MDAQKKDIGRVSVECQSNIGRMLIECRLSIERHIDTGPIVGRPLLGRHIDR